MKFLLSTFFILFIATNSFTSAFGQTIPNGDLELWEWGAGGWQLDPSEWVTMNNQITASAIQESIACEGTLAMKVTPLPAIETQMGVASLEFPIYAIPAQLNFCVRTNIVQQDLFVDTCRVIISFWNGANEFYSEEWVNTESIDEWTQISIPLNQIEPLMDGCKIEVQASFPGIGLGSGSLDTWITVDDFNFDTTNSIDLLARSEVSIYPNPSSDGIINVSSSNNLGEILIYDLLGNLIRDERINGNTYSSKEVLSSGIYFISVNGAIQKFIVD